LPYNPENHVSLVLGYMMYLGSGGGTGLVSLL